MIIIPELVHRIFNQRTICEQSALILVYTYKYTELSLMFCSVLA